MEIRPGKREIFLDKFDISIRQRFADILSKWADRGDLSIQGSEYFLSRSALLQIDSLLQNFFLPAHRDATRYV